MADETKGELVVKICIVLPTDKGDYYRQQGATVNKDIQVFSTECTEADGIKMTETIRLRNPGMADRLFVVWTGPRKL